MKRRDILKYGLGLTVVPFLPKIVSALTRSPQRPPQAVPRSSRLSISNILVARYPAVLAEMRHGQPWVNPKLNQLTKDGALEFQTLRATVAFAGTPHTHVPVQEITVPIIWSHRTS